MKMANWQTVHFLGCKATLNQLMTAPITGFGDTNIYFVDFGIKTAKDGSYVFDQKSFNRTYY